MGEYICFKCNRRNWISYCGVCGNKYLSSQIDQRIGNDGLLERCDSGIFDKLVIPEGVKRISHQAFNGNSIKKVIFPSTLVSVDGFSMVKALKEVELPMGVKEIESRAFSHCESLKEIVIPSSVVKLGDSAFSGCKNLKRVVLSPGIKEISSSAFWGCGKLEEIVIPEGVETIGEYAFYGCSNLNRLILPSTLKVIEKEAFYKGFGSTSFKKIALPRGMTHIGKDAFEGIDRECEFIVGAHTASERFVKSGGWKYSTEDMNECNGWAIAGKEKYLIADGQLYRSFDKGKKITIPEGTKVIRSGAFGINTNLEEVVFPASLLMICDFAFDKCESLRKISFSDGIKSIGKRAFGNFKGDIVDLPETVEKIDADAFGYQCSVSVGGEMPLYKSYQKNLNEKSDEIQKEKQTLENTKKCVNDQTKALEKHRGNIPAAIGEIPMALKKCDDIKSEKKAWLGEDDVRENAMRGEITSIGDTVRNLMQERKNCFFLAISKKKTIDGEIEAHKQRLADAEGRLEALLNERKLKIAEYDMQLSEAEKQFEKLLAVKVDYKNRECGFEDSISAGEREIKESARIIAELEAQFEKQKAELENALAEWKKKRQEKLAKQQEEERKEIERQRIEALKNQKERILSGFIYPAKPQSRSIITEGDKKQLVEVSLLNKAYGENLANKEASEFIAKHNEFIRTHNEDIKLLRETNIALGLPQNDGITYFASYTELEPPMPIEKKLPDRFVQLCGIFSKINGWREFKRLAKATSIPKKIDDKECSDFFGDADYFAFSCERYCALFFSYCAVVFNAEKPMRVLPYNKIKLSVEYTEKNEITDKVHPYGELISEQYRYLNKDGSVSRRYKDNPLIKTVRYTTVAIDGFGVKLELPVKKYDMALQLKNAFELYRSLLHDEWKTVYSRIVASADVSEITECIKTKEEKEKKRREQERKAFEAEQKQLEEERLQAEAEAERKRKEIIERQRELNEERKRQAQEKAESAKRIARLFDDDFASVEDERAGGDGACTICPFEIDGSCLISNTVFKISIKRPENVGGNDTVAFFVNGSDEIISNKKKIIFSDSEEGVSVGFILNSGIDYTSMKECFMRFESSGEKLGDIEFKMNISFYSDF